MQKKKNMLLKWFFIKKKLSFFNIAKEENYSNVPNVLSCNNIIYDNVNSEGFFLRVLLNTIQVDTTAYIDFAATKNSKKIYKVKFKGRNNKKLNKKKLVNAKDFIFLKNLNLFNKDISANLLNNNLSLSLDYNWVLSKYMASILSTYTGLYSEWTFLNLRKLPNNENFYLMCLTINKKKFLGPFYHSYKPIFYNWFIKLTLLKDPSGIIPLIHNVLLHSHLKRHKILFFNVNRLLKIWYHFVKIKYNVKGYSFFFKGKLGKKGSVKKSKFFRKCGLNSLTNKNLRYNYKTYSIITITGVVGAGINIFYIGMFTLTILYILFYIITLVQILWYLEAHKFISSFTQLSFTNAWQGVANYAYCGWVFQLLLLQLSGLPPVFIFFLKVNLLALSLKYTTIFLQVLIFINLLLSMFFYLQIFNTTSDNMSKQNLKLMARDSDLTSINLKTSIKKYNFYLFFTTVLFFSMFSFIFFFDFYVIVYSFIM